MTAGLAPVAFVCATAILFGAGVLLAAPRWHQATGFLVLVASGGAFYAYGWLGPSVVGVALGIAAGVLAVQWAPPQSIAREAVPATR